MAHALPLATRFWGCPAAGCTPTAFRWRGGHWPSWTGRPFSPQLNDTIGNTLLTPHRSYLADVQALQAAGVEIRGLAHITGGGLIDNPPRIFPAGLGAKIRRGSWPVPPIFTLIQQQGHISDAEMAHVFNLGLGMLVVVPREQAALVKTAVPQAHLVGEIAAGIEGVVFEEWKSTQINADFSFLCASL
jgi:phosphoribosylformylglycinamidine cyclo-ligase